MTVKIANLKVSVTNVKVESPEFKEQDKSGFKPPVNLYPPVSGFPNHYDPNGQSLNPPYIVPRAVKDNMCPIDPGCAFYEVDENGVKLGCAQCFSNNNSNHTTETDYEGALLITTSSTDFGIGGAATQCTPKKINIENCIWQEYDKAGKRFCRRCAKGFAINTTGNGCDLAPETYTDGKVDNCASYATVGTKTACTSCLPYYNLFFVDGSLPSCKSFSETATCSSLVSGCLECFIDNRTIARKTNLCLKCSNTLIGRFYSLSASSNNKAINTYSSCDDCSSWHKNILFLPKLVNELN